MTIHFTIGELEQVLTEITLNSKRNLGTTVDLISKHTEIQQNKVRKICKKLQDEGKIYSDFLTDEDTGLLCGKGYLLID